MEIGTVGDSDVSVSGINCNKRTNLEGEAEGGRDCARVGPRPLWELCTFCSTMNLELLYEILCFKNTTAFLLDSRYNSGPTTRLTWDLKGGGTVGAKFLIIPSFAFKPAFASVGSAKRKGPVAGLVGVERRDVGTQRAWITSGPWWFWSGWKKSSMTVVPSDCRRRSHSLGGPVPQCCLRGPS